MSGLHNPLFLLCYKKKLIQKFSIFLTFKICHFCQFKKNLFFKKFQEGRLSGLHNFGTSLSNNVTTASGSTSSSQNYTDLSLSHLTSSWNQQQGGGQSIEHGGPGGLGGPGGPGGPGVQNSRHMGGPGTNTPSISLSTAASHTIPQLSITSSTSSPPSNSPADGKRNIFLTKL